MQKIHLDTDLGGDIDDLCALAMLLRWEGAELAGITTVAEANGRIRQLYSGSRRKRRDPGCRGCRCRRGLLKQSIEQSATIIVIAPFTLQRILAPQNHQQVK